MHRISEKKRLQLEEAASIDLLTGEILKEHHKKALWSKHIVWIVRKQQCTDAVKTQECRSIQLENGGSLSKILFEKFKEIAEKL